MVVLQVSQGWARPLLAPAASSQSGCGGSGLCVWAQPSEPPLDYLLLRIPLPWGPLDPPSLSFSLQESVQKPPLPRSLLDFALPFLPPWLPRPYLSVRPGGWAPGAGLGSWAAVTRGRCSSEPQKAEVPGGGEQISQQRQPVGDPSTHGGLDSSQQDPAQGAAPSCPQNDAALSDTISKAVVFI